MTFGSKKLAAATLIAAAAVGGGGALAFFSGQGSGSGSAAVASASEGLIIAPGSPTAGLYPGGSGDVAVAISNPNAVPVHVGSLFLGGWSVDEGHEDCADPDLRATTPQTNAGLGWKIPPGQTVAVDLADAVAMGPEAGDACQGASFTVELQVGS
jgi:hypothetical protein